MVGVYKCEKINIEIYWKKTLQLTSILSDRGSFCCWGIWTACCTHCVIWGDIEAAADDGSGPKIVGTNCPGAKYGL